MHRSPADDASAHVASPVTTPRKLLWGSGVLCLALLTACTLPRRPAPVSGIATPVGFPVSIRHVSSDEQHVASAAAGLGRARRASTGGPIHILALSGGGAGGAFGAGALVGLSRRGERPQYDIVTGVSTGALIAPFAFLGPDWDAQLKDAFTTERAENHLTPGLLSLILGPTRSRAAGLKSLVGHYVTDSLIKAVAKEAADGRMLLVVTTDLDTQKAVIWDMGRIAAVGGTRARQLFRDVLVASASIPGYFSPAMIRVKDGGKLYDEMHVDGNVTTAMLVASDAAYISPLTPVGLRDAQVYVLINGQLGSPPSTTETDLSTILSHSVGAALTYLARSQLLDAKQFAANHGETLRATAVPPAHPQIAGLDFRASVMRPLFEYGRQCAERGQLWTTADQLLSSPSPRQPAHGQLECPSP